MDSAGLPERHAVIRKPLARHLLVELYGCDPRIINDVAALERIMNAAASAAGATIVQSVFHTYGAQGASGVVVIAESHLSAHTWPEHAYVAVDVFTCGTSLAPEAAIALMKTSFAAQSVAIVEHARGLI